MPWKIEHRGDQFCVVKEGTNENVKCHATKEKAESHMKALYATETSKSFIVKNAEQRYTLGIVYEPDAVDSHGDFTTATEIENACWNFNKAMQQQGHLVKQASLLLDAFVKAADGQDTRVAISPELLTKGMLGIQHSNWDDSIGDIVESYIAPVDMILSGEVVRKGTWLMGTVWNQENWEKIQRGELTGYSLGGKAVRVPVDA